MVFGLWIGSRLLDIECFLDPELIICFLLLRDLFGDLELLFPLELTS